MYFFTKLSPYKLNYMPYSIAFLGVLMLLQYNKLPSSSYIINNSTADYWADGIVAVAVQYSWNND